VFAAASDPAVSRFVSWEPHTSVEQSEAFIASELKRAQEGGRWSWAITEREKDTFIGFIVLCPAKTQPRAEVGYWLGKPYWGKGYMTEALKLLIRLSFEELGLNRVQATHSTQNPASGRVMTKAGMTYEATLRQYIISKASRMTPACIPSSGRSISKRTTETVRGILWRIKREESSNSITLPARRTPA
jgi:ribosomal-protein-alanine N-acetyltransferase